MGGQWSLSTAGCSFMMLYSVTQALDWTKMGGTNWRQGGGY